MPASNSQNTAKWTVLVTAALLLWSIFGAATTVATGSTADNASTAAESVQTLIEAARKQVGVTIRYDGSYQRLDYPMGDVEESIGVCTDVIIRALRVCGHDLQKLIHEDMRRAFGSYPQNWGLSRPDRNIDHRRVPNLKRYFARQQMRLPLPADPAAALDRFKPGDFVTCTVPPHLPHIMIISDKTNGDGVPLVIHNIGRGAREEDRLLSFPLTGHYRWFGSE